MFLERIGVEKFRSLQHHLLHYHSAKQENLGSNGNCIQTMIFRSRAPCASSARLLEPPEEDHPLRISVLLFAVLLPVALCAYSPALHLAFEGTLNAHTGLAPVSTSGTPAYIAGQTGKAVNLTAGTFVTYPSKGVLNKAHGSVVFWLRPNWNGNDGQNHALLADQADFNDRQRNALYLWKENSGRLRLDLRSPLDSYVTYDVSQWQAGQWHFIGATWDAANGLALYVDGECVARRETRWDVRDWPQFNLGGDWAGKATGDAAFDELQMFPIALRAEHIAALMQGLPLEEATVTTLVAPRSAQMTVPFQLKATVTAPQSLTRDYAILIETGGVEVARVTPVPTGKLWAPGKPVELLPLTVTIPSYLRVPSGPIRLTARVEGAVADPQASPAETIVNISPAPGEHSRHFFEIDAKGQPRRDKQPFPSQAPGTGFLYQGVFYTADASGREKACELIRRGLAYDALPARLLDTVNCAKRDHDFGEYGRSTVCTLPPGEQFRVTGPPETVIEKTQVNGSAQRVLPAFSYTLANTPLPVAHVLVAELANDRERYTEIAIDAAPGSSPGAHVAVTGSGETRLVDLATVYTGREYPCDNQLLRHQIVFYPKSTACQVTISSSGRELEKTPESGAAVARLSVYELLDEGQALYNTLTLPKDQPQRSVGIFFPEHSFMYSQFGFSGLGDQQRRTSLLGLFDYMGLMGVNRLEFHPLAFGMKAYFNGSKLPNTASYDVFDDLLPLADERGIQVVPAVDGMAFYDKCPEFTRDSFQLDKDGKRLRKAVGDVPDPLRPEVQARLMSFLSEILNRVRGHQSVPFVAFQVDGQAGTCYVGTSRNDPPEDAGYSEWDIAQFEQATGLQVGGTAGDAPSRYAALHSDPQLWEKWITWRCDATRAFWLKCRDLVVSRGDERQLLIKTSLPNDFPGKFNLWQERKQDRLEILRNFGYDPRLYDNEKGLRFTRTLLVGADRYFGEPENKTFHYDSQEFPFYRTAEGTETQLYGVNWELPNHPRGLRTGAASGPGRAFFEPLTYTLRYHNPYNLTFSNWYPGTIGHELDLRRFIRAYRALPAIPAAEFDGQIHPQDPQLVVKVYGNRLAVINDSGKPRHVRLTFPKVFRFGTRITNVGSGQELPQFVGKASTRVELDLEAWDLATLDVDEMHDSSIRK